MTSPSPSVDAETSSEFVEWATGLIDAAFMSPPPSYKLKRENRELMITILADKITGFMGRAAGSRKPALDPATVEACAKACEARIKRGADGEPLSDWDHYAPYNAEDMACAKVIRALAGKEGGMTDLNPSFTQ
jgi:hypothetical protein